MGLGEDFFRFLSVERSLSRNTCLAYASDARAYLAHCAAAGRDPLKADQRFVEDYLWALRGARKLKASSVYRKTEALRSFYRFLLLEGRVSGDPTRNFRAPKLGEKVPRYLSRQDMERLLSYPAGEDFAMVRTVAAVELLYAAGLRVSELIGLRLESLGLDQGWVRVFGKGGKERVVPVHRAAVDALKRYLEARQLRFAGGAADAELFVNRYGRKISRVQVWKDIRALGREAGVRIVPHPHLFRHTFASHLVQAGADLRSVQEMLGHSSLNTTQIYAHVDKSGVKSAHERFHPDK